MARSCPTSSPGPRSRSSVRVSSRTQRILPSVLNVISFLSLSGVPGTKAVNSLVFAEYLNRVLWNATRGDDAPSEVIPHWVINTTAVAAVVFVFVLVVGTRSLGPRAAVVLTSIKVRDLEARTQLTIISGFYQGPRISTSILKRYVILVPKLTPGSSPLFHLALSTHSLVAALPTGIQNAPSIHPLRSRRMHARYTPVFGHLMVSIKLIMSLVRCGTQRATSHVRSTYPWGL